MLGGVCVLRAWILQLQVDMVGGGLWGPWPPQRGTTAADWDSVCLGGRSGCQLLVGHTVVFVFSLSLSGNSPFTLQPSDQGQTSGFGRACWRWEPGMMGRSWGCRWGWLVTISFIIPFQRNDWWIISEQLGRILQPAKMTVRQLDSHRLLTVSLGLTVHVRLQPFAAWPIMEAGEALIAQTVNKQLNERLQRARRVC